MSQEERKLKEISERSAAVFKELYEKELAKNKKLVPNPKPLADMIKAFGEIIGYEYDDNYITANLDKKPHGRVAINLNIGGDNWIDLSIWPTAPQGEKS